jgi:hypothetical protein
MKKRILWIDSICIDQSSASERSLQVKLMSDVYQNAQDVLIWLGDIGEMNGLTKIQFAGAYLVDQIIKAVVHNGVKDCLHWRLLFSTSRQPITGKGALLIYVLGNGRFSRLLAAFIYSPWYFRVWTIQESALAKSQTFLLGPLTIRPLPYEFLMDKVVSGRNSTLMYHNEQVQNLLNSLSIRNSAVDLMGSAQVSNLYWDLMCRISSHNASDPKDYVYGLYEILRLSGLALPNPDYTKSIATIYAEVARAIAHRYNNFEFIFDYPPMESTLDLPSWVPNWTARMYSSKTKFSRLGPFTPMVLRDSDFREWRFYSRALKRMDREENQDRESSHRFPTELAENDIDSMIRLDAIQLRLKCSTLGRCAGVGLPMDDDALSMVDQLVKVLNSWLLVAASPAQIETQILEAKDLLRLDFFIFVVGKGGWSGDIAEAP